MTNLPSGHPRPAPAIEFRGVFKTFPGGAAVRGLDWVVPAATLYVLLGPNGAGKTTSLRMAVGLTAPSAGGISVLGHDIALEPELVKRKLAFLADEPMLYGLLRPLEHLEFVAGLWDLPAIHAGRRAEELLRWLDLWHHRGKFIESFSRGMKQKLALAGALIHDPALIVLDEPLTGLDVPSARMVKDLLRDSVERGVAVVLTTHIMEVAERLAQRIGIIDAGRLVAQGTLAELQARGGRSGHLEDIFLEIVGAPG
jgi:ABC-2 type transport system ATP-binding protein